jgi:glutathione peroxidase
MTMPPTVYALPRALAFATALASSALPATAPRAAGLDALAPLMAAHAIAASTMGGAVPGRTLLAAAEMDGGADCPPLLRHTFTRLQGGATESLCQYRGKVLLVVNTASYCGFTRQYEGLEQLYRRYKDRGLVVIGFPSNDFLQEPGSNKEVAEFCRTTYGVQFPMFEKSTVASLAANPFYAELAKRAGGGPKWNFYKYVVDRAGTQVTSFSSVVEPDSKQLVDLIERLLAAKPQAASG